MTFLELGTFMLQQAEILRESEPEDGLWCYADALEQRALSLICAATMKQAVQVT